MSKRRMSEIFAQDRYGQDDQEPDDRPDDRLNPWDELVIAEDPAKLEEKFPIVEGPYGTGMTDRNIMHPDYLPDEERRKQMYEDI